MFVACASVCRSQDSDSSELFIRDIVESAYKDLAMERSINDLPPYGEYYIAKIELMNGVKKKMTFYRADSTKIFVFTDTTNKILDSIHASNIRFISFREKGRTWKVIGGAAGAGFAIGGIAGYVSAPCDDCEDGDLSFPGLVRGAGWGIAAGIATGTVGAIVAIFNNGSFKIKGDPKKFKKNFHKLRKYSINTD
jgi:hypothetical protein